MTDKKISELDTMTDFADGDLLAVVDISENKTKKATKYEVMIGTQGVQGSQGNQGYQGNTGSQGYQGNQGVQGSQGNQGFQGYQGPQGPQGNQGFQGYQGPQGNQGFQGMVGSTGSQGSQGNQGDRGYQGQQGNQGSQGTQGTQGVQGLKGDKGDQGNQGDQGDQGEKGDQGDQGFQGYQGNQGNQGLAGGSTNWLGEWSNLTNYVIDDAVSHNGSSYICIQNNNGQEPPSVSYWALLASKGDQGNQGDQGDQGTTGATGSQGTAGTQGPQGTQGYQGPQGYQGSQGSGTNSIISNETPSGALDGVDTTYTLANTPITGTLKLYLNGQRLTYTEDYTLATNVITFVVAPVEGDLIRADYELAGAATGNADTLDNKHAPTGDIVGTSDSQTLSNKTLTAPVLNGALSGDAKSTGATITTGTADDEFVTPKALADATVGKLGAAWTSWNPTFTNFTKGSATIVAKYSQIGKTVSFRLSVTLAADSSMGTSPRFTLPVTAVSGYPQYLSVGHSSSWDANASVNYLGVVAAYSTTEYILYSQVSSGVDTQLKQISSTSPMTWTTGDIIWAIGTYEAA